MQILTREQREAVKRVFDRCPVFDRGSDGLPVQLTYRQFRRTVQPTFFMDNAIALPWCGMWLAIERDGYTHS